jgi:hypothetical protein
VAVVDLIIDKVCGSTRDLTGFDNLLGNQPFTLWPRQWSECYLFSLHCFLLHLLVLYTVRRPSLQPHCLRKDAVCPTCHPLTSSSPSSTPLGRPLPSGTLFCFTGKSAGRITRCVFPSILSFILTNPIVSGSSGPFHPGKCWVRPPNSFNSFVGRTTILCVPVHLLPRVHLACHSTTRLLRWCVSSSPQHALG